MKIRKLAVQTSTISKVSAALLRGLHCIIQRLSSLSLRFSSLWAWRALLLATLLSVLVFSQARAIVAGSNALAHDAAARYQPPGCVDLVTNGGFEAIGPGWNAVASNRPAEYSNAQTFDGSGLSMQLGIVNLPNAVSESGVDQVITLPIDASSIVLSFHYYPLYDPNPGEGDEQFVDIYNAFTNQFVGRALGVLRNDRSWVLRQYDLTAQAGQQVRLHFAVKNDGAGGRTAMYLDNVSILACNVAPTVPVPQTETPTPTATNQPPGPTLTPTFTTVPLPSVTNQPTPTAQPGCATFIINGDFEGGGFWIFGQDPVPPRYTNTLVHNGERAVLQGNPPELGLQNVFTYSSVRQLVEIPANATSVQLRWWHYYRSEEAPVDNPTNIQDRQEVLLLTQDLETLAILLRTRRNDGEWQESVLDLTQYRGRSFYVYFNTYNDGAGGRTWAYLDDVIMDTCYPPTTPTSLPLPTPTPTTVVSPTPTHTATVLPAATPSPIATPTLVPTATNIRPPPAPAATATVANSLLGPTINFGATETANAFAREAAIIFTATAQAAALRTDREGPLATPIDTLSPPATPSANVDNTPIVGAVLRTPPAWRERLGIVAVLFSVLVAIIGLAALFWNQSAMGNNRE